MEGFVLLSAKLIFSGVRVCLCVCFFHSCRRVLTLLFVACEWILGNGALSSTMSVHLSTAWADVITSSLFNWRTHSVASEQTLWLHCHGFVIRVLLLCYLVTEFILLTLMDVSVWSIVFFYLFSKCRLVYEMYVNWFAECLGARWKRYARLLSVDILLHINLCVYRSQCYLLTYLLAVSMWLPCWCF